MRENKYIGVYYSDSHFKDLNAFTTFSLFFDEIHLITHSTTLSGQEPTDYFKDLPDTIQIALPKEYNESEISNLKELMKFVVNNKVLIGDLLYYHNHLVGGSISRFTQKLLSGKVPLDDFINFLAGNTEEIQNFEQFKKDNPEFNNEYHLGISATAYDLATKNDWILIGDQSDIKIPFMSEDKNNVKLLSSLIAEECLQIILPKSISLNAEDILTARDKLKGELVPFRMTLQKMSFLLRDGIRNSHNIDEVRKEAKFLAESQVEPALNEIIRRIEIEKDKLWIKIFGKTLSWIPLVAKTFIMPSPDDLFKIMDKAYGDVGAFASTINDFNLAKEPGLSFLLKTDKIISKKAHNKRFVSRI